MGFEISEKSIENSVAKFAKYVSEFHNMELLEDTPENDGIISPFSM